MKFFFNFSLFVIKHFQFINRECRKLFVEADVPSMPHLKFGTIWKQILEKSLLVLNRSIESASQFISLFVSWQLLM